MLRLALVSAATYGLGERTPGSWHGTAFATAFNGCDDVAAGRLQWTFARAQRQLPGARVVKVWDPHKEWSEHLADVCGIDEVARTPAECAQDVDAVLVVDDGSREQWRLALPAIDAGLPTFIDKPLAMNARDAQAVIDRAQASGALLMSASSLRYVPDIQALKAALPSLGPISMATTICGNELIYYGIHALETTFEVFGDAMRGQVESVHNVGREGRSLCRVRCGSGLDVMLMVGQPEYCQAGYQINVYGKQGWRSVEPRLDDLYVYLLEQFLGMIETKRQPVGNDEMCEVIATLAAAQRSLDLGREVNLAEVR